MVEDLADDVGILDAGEKFDVAAAALADFDIEHTL